MKVAGTRVETVEVDRKGGILDLLGNPADRVSQGGRETEGAA
jgi:hypothetical protein